MTVAEWPARCGASPSWIWAVADANGDTYDAPHILVCVVDVRFVEEHGRLMNRIRTALRPAAEQHESVAVSHETGARLGCRRLTEWHWPRPGARGQVEAEQIVEHRVIRRAAAEHIHRPSTGVVHGRVTAPFGHIRRERAKLLLIRIRGTADGPQLDGVLNLRGRRQLQLVPVECLTSFEQCAQAEHGVCKCGHCV